MICRSESESPYIKEGQPFREIMVKGIHEPPEGFLSKKASISPAGFSVPRKSEIGVLNEKIDMRGGMDHLLRGYDTD